MPTADAPPPRPLIVRLRNYVGDVVLGVPALRWIESRGFRPVLVGKAWAGPLLAGHGWTVHVRPKTLRERVAQLRALREACAAEDPGFRRRENALVMPYSFGSALEMRLAGLRAVGYRWEARHWLLARSGPMRVGEHELRIYDELAGLFLRETREPPASIGLQVSAAHQQAADALIAAHGLPRDFVVLVPFATGRATHGGKMWPHFRAYAEALLREGRTLVACPGPGEDAVLRERLPAAVVALPGLDLGTYAGVLKRAALVVANDTGPGHMAAALGTPLISVFGRMKPRQWAPWGPNARYLHRWPEWPSVEQVLEAGAALRGGAPAALGA